MDPLCDAYRDAMLIQNACNLSGVLRTWVRHLATLNDIARDQNLGTDWVNHHPINILFASKVASLTGCESSGVFSQAYQAAQEQIAADRLIDTPSPNATSDPQS